MYSSLFCSIYDALGWNTYPQALGEQLWEWLCRNGIPVRSCVDLGCGTGVLCQTLQAHGVRTVGIDQSQGMIDIARRNVPLGDFRVADMVAYRPEGRYDLVTCTGDALNHVIETDKLNRLFANAYTALNPGGVFFFDLLRSSEIPDSEPFELDYSPEIKARFRTEKDKDGVIHLQVAIYENGKLRQEEDIREKLHDPGMVCGLLRRAGFVILLSSDRLDLTSPVHGTTWFIAAGKPGK